MIQSEFGPKEAQAVAEIIRLAKAVVQENRLPTDADGEPRLALRDQHPKSHGCVGAELIVEDVPNELRHGVFKEPNRYPAWIRFSNGAGRIQSDATPDIRGMAIKVMGVEGEKILEEEKQARTQDFIAINSEAFFLKDIQDVLALSKTVTTIDKIPPIPLLETPLKLLTFVLLFARSHRTQVEILSKAREQAVFNPLSIQYWSGTPYKLGPHEIKFTLKPRGIESSAENSEIDKSSDNFLREAMVEHLKENEAGFDFLVQLRSEPQNMPLEDATIQWHSEYQKVATIKIHKQVFDTPKRRDFDENLSFDIWRSLPEHEPLAKINKLRRLVYEETSKLRHQLNNKLRQEPLEEEYYQIFGEM
ncbi:MAG: catalase family protein [Pseudanabaenales cyanobacterium]|nr:catalase family protein [Pseudanabaenales cyanobacterium]